VNASKQTTRIKDWPGKPDQRLLDTEYDVVATDSESMSFWQNWHQTHGFPYQQVGLMLMRQLGELSGEPIWVMVTWDRWARRLVANVEITCRPVITRAD
jgi:type II secretory pathway component PulL